MPDISAELISCSFRIMLHPMSNSLSCLMRAPAPYAPAAVRVHAPHHHWLQRLYQCVMDVLVRPLRRFHYRPPLPGVLVVPLALPRLPRHEPRRNNLPQLLYPVLPRLLHPCGARVRAVPPAPAVRPVHLVHRQPEVFLRDYFLEHSIDSLHQDSCPPFGITGFPSHFMCVLARSLAAYLHQGVSGRPRIGLEDSCLASVKRMRQPMFAFAFEVLL